MKRNFVLISGSSRGLGQALALVFARNNYNIILNSRDKKNLKLVRNQILKNEVECEIVLGDIRLDNALDDLERLSREKGLLVLVNNAGLQCPHLPLEKISDEQIDDMIVTNLVAQIQLTKRIYQYFIEKGNGTIININSLSGLRNHELRSIYSASKWGLRGFSDSFRIEAKKNNVRILDVYSGRIKTKPEFIEGMKTEEVAQKIYDAFQNTGIEKIEIDGRSKK